MLLLPKPSVEIWITQFSRKDTDLCGGWSAMAVPTATAEGKAICTKPAEIIDWYDIRKFGWDEFTEF